MNEVKEFTIGYGGVKKILIGGKNPLVYFGGPCAIESLDHTLFMAEKIKTICDELEIPFVFKACYDKDCRSSPDSFNGVGIDLGLKILSKVREEFGVPVVSDFSVPDWASATGAVCDLVQVPAYLCRQTSILQAAASTNRPILLKKGQYMSPWNMKNSVKKLNHFGCEEIILTDRGTFFGYNMLVNDFTSLPIMSSIGYPVCFDATHSIQMPTSMGEISGGQRQYIPHLVRSAAANGIDALFMEVHDRPDEALSDPNTVLNLNHLRKMLIQVKRIEETIFEMKDTLGEINHV